MESSGHGGTGGQMTHSISLGQKLEKLGKKSCLLFPYGFDGWCLTMKKKKCPQMMTKYKYSQFTVIFISVFQVHNLFFVFVFFKKKGFIRKVKNSSQKAQLSDTEERFL